VLHGLLELLSEEGCRSLFIYETLGHKSPP
jgi:hypothetical protein